MALLIPFSPKQSGDQLFRVDIGGAVVTLRLFWNVRDQAWYMDVQANVAQILSVKLVPRSPLIRGRRNMGVAGDFYVVESKQEAVRPIGFDALGDSWDLYWFAQGEFDGL